MTEQDMIIQELRRENEALRAELEWKNKVIELAQRNEMRWISVEDSLPETNNKGDHLGDVLCYVPPRDGCRQHGFYLGKIEHIAADDGSGNFWGVPTPASDWAMWGWSYFEEPVVTHWMPLPEKPEEGLTMTEYIEREALLRDLGEKPPAWCDTESEIQERSDWQLFKSIIDAQPTANVAPVVHCKDCRRWKSKDNINGRCPVRRFETPYTGFCEEGIT